MGTIWIREFTGGLDLRRMAETTSGGALLRGRDGHINRGGEFEQRAAFVKEYTLPSGTVGLAYGKTSIYVFGHAAAPTLPSGVAYQRLQHPDGVTALTAVPSWDLFAGKIYAVGEFADGSRYHFYDGTRVSTWFDGRARASFLVSGSIVAAVAARGSFEITAGTASAGVNKITDIKVDGVSIIAAAVDHTGTNSTTATAVANAINSYASSPDYTATTSGQTVIITAATTGTTANGKAITVTVGGDATAANLTVFSGGSAAAPAQVTSITVAGVEILGATISWATTNAAMATAIAAQINSQPSSPEYVATATGDQLNIIAADNGAAANGRTVVFATANGTSFTGTATLAGGGGDPVTGVGASGSFTVTGGTVGAANKINAITVNGIAIISGAVLFTTDAAGTAAAVASAINAFSSSPDYTAVASGAVVTVTSAVTGSAINGKDVVVTVGGNVTVGNPQAMSGGIDAVTVFQPGAFVKTIGSKEYSTSGPNMHFSGIKVPTGWTTDNVGAGFIDMSAEAAGSEVLTALAKYQNYVAVFAERLIQIWYVDPDPANNKVNQVLNNTGTLSPRSVTQFGDSDLFYLDASGLRSLRARTGTTSAATNDIGIPVDKPIIAKLADMTDDEKTGIIGLIEPSDGRFWLIFPDEIFVLSYFPGSKVSAWSTYTPQAYSAGSPVTLTPSHATVFRRKVYVRSGNDIYVYGGLGSTVEFDETQPELWLPYLDGDKPTVKKTFVAIDAACEGEWEVRLATQPTNEAAYDVVGRVTSTSFNNQSITARGEGTHVSLRLIGQSAGYKRISSAVIHYQAADDED